jgi:hypothetical protein
VSRELGKRRENKKIWKKREPKRPVGTRRRRREENLKEEEDETTKTFTKTVKNVR